MVDSLYSPKPADAGVRENESCNNAAQGVEKLLCVMRLLRSPGGCPWDREQDHTSIRGNLLEECHETLDAIIRGDDDALCEELGDILLQIVFHAQMASERGAFSFEDVIRTITDKLIIRHPHVFGEETADTSEQVLKNWESIKQREKSFDSRADALRAIPQSFPALLRADKLFSRARKAGYDITQHSDDAFLLAAASMKDPELVLHERLDKFIDAFEIWEKTQQTAKQAYDD